MDRRLIATLAQAVLLVGAVSVMATTAGTWHAIGYATAITIASWWILVGALPLRLPSRRNLPGRQRREDGDDH